MNFATVSVFYLLIIFWFLISQNFALLFNITDFLGMRSLDNRFNSPEGHELVTQLDGLRGTARFIREYTLEHYDWEKTFQQNKRLGKTQREISANVPFPCDLSYARSSSPPTTVHKLRPGDIDIVAVMGDSMSAGTCLMAENVLGVVIENRGLAFSGGGYGNWRQFLTLPNILKVFNPNLYGYSVDEGFNFYDTSRLNVAEPSAMSRDLVHQAKLLIQRMRKDPNVDFKRHWKLLTIFIGNVDFCGDLCAYDDVSIPLRYHEEDLRKSLSLLRDNVPHLFVNLLPTPNSIWTFKNMKVPTHCYIIHRLFCPCVVNVTATDAGRRAFDHKMHLWQDLDAYIASLAEFNTEDFTVVFHPFFIDPQTPTLPNGDTDGRYFGADCFHFSQLGHAALANTLWNSMMQPFGYKLRSFNTPFAHFECPNAKHPYLATFKNSLGVKV